MGSLNIVIGLIHKQPEKIVDNFSNDFLSELFHQGDPFLQGVINKLVFL